MSWFESNETLTKKHIYGFAVLLADQAKKFRLECDHDDHLHLGSSFFSWLPVPPGGKNRISGKIKNVPEVSKVPRKIQIVSRTLGVPLEIRNRSGTIEKFRSKKLNLSLKICNFGGKFKSSAGGRTSPAKI
ncbi:MAG TPA: hypothetical protein VGQ08_18210 [Nitrospiraceae bacterium]|nr:hypothetical protein [Nitrospiraceae bacterium]